MGGARRCPFPADAGGGVVGLWKTGFGGLKGEG